LILDPVSIETLNEIRPNQPTNTQEDSIEKAPKQRKNKEKNNNSEMKENRSKRTKLVL
jgi:hypothetical protein